MVGWVKYGPDCWMMEGDGKCRAEADARGLPANRDTVGIRAAAASRGQTKRGREERHEAQHVLNKQEQDVAGD